MYSVPESTQRRLRNEFRDRIRIRWSPRAKAFQVEGRSHRGLSDFPIPTGLSKLQVAKLFDRHYDDLVRAKDGYQLIMEIQPGTRMACPGEDCPMELRVPVNRTAEVACGYCKARKRDGRYVASYFDLQSEALIERLRYLDPERTWRVAGLKQIDTRNAALERGREQDASNFIDSVNRDEYNGIAGILSNQGTTGKTSNWLDAPESPLVKALA
jgi:hypothetical protein